MNAKPVLFSSEAKVICFLLIGCADESKLLYSKIKLTSNKAARLLIFIKNQTLKYQFHQ